MFVQPPDKNERLLKYALVGLGATLVLAMFSALYFDAKAPLPSGSGKAAQEPVLTPEAELKLQEQIAPLIKAGDMKACDQVRNEMYKKVCINNIALNKAEETKDISFCQYLDDILLARGECEREIVFQNSIEKEDVQICDTATGEDVRFECRDAFYFWLANKSNDVDACRQARIPNQCKDSYYLQKFIQDSKSIDCSVFSSVDAVSDCSMAQTLLVSTKEPERSMKFCENQKSKIFGEICAMKNTSFNKQMTPSKPMSTVGESRQ